MAEPEATNLTGVWSGLYSYAGQGEPTPFTATLLETGAYFSGSTHETCLVEGRQRATLCALVEGTRRGRAVGFIKTYDGSGGWDHSVAYTGALSANGLEIEGTWRVRGGISGRFLMIRPARDARTAKQQVRVGVDA
jgi:hypothetical protein